MGPIPTLELGPSPKRTPDSNMAVRSTCTEDVPPTYSYVVLRTALLQQPGNIGIWVASRMVRGVTLVGWMSLLSYGHTTLQPAH